MRGISYGRNSWLEQRGFGGLDWTSQKHSVIVVDPQGKVMEDFEIEHSALVRVKEVPRTNSPLRLDSFCDRDKPGRGRQAIVGSPHGGLPAQPQERTSLPGPQSAQWSQRRRAGRLEFCR